MTLCENVTSPPQAWLLPHLVLIKKSVKLDLPDRVKSTKSASTAIRMKVIKIYQSGKAYKAIAKTLRLQRTDVKNHISRYWCDYRYIVHPWFLPTKVKAASADFFYVRVSLHDFFFFFFSSHEGIFTKCKWSDHTVKPCLLNKLCITLNICSYVTSHVLTAQVNTSAYVSANGCLSVFLCDKLVTCQGRNPAFAHWQLGQAQAPPCDPECSRGGCRKWMNKRFIPQCCSTGVWSSTKSVWLIVDQPD